MEKLKNFFLNLIEQGKLSHAYYFEGNANEFVNWISRLIFCLNGTGEDQCGNCRRIMNGNHPDIIEVVPDGLNIKVEQIRELQNKLGYLSIEGFGQIAIIREADKMNIQAANALLKTLEEPKDKTYLFLIGNSRDKLLSTILSRVQVIKVPNINFTENIVKERGLDFPGIKIFQEMNLSMELMAKYGEKASYWIEIVQTTLTSSKYQALNWVQKWEEIFNDKETRAISIQLIQHYIKSMLKQKKGERQLWERIPSLDWQSLSKWIQECDVLTRGIYSNGQYSLQLENFICNVMDR